MNKKARVIGCLSGEERHHLIFRSMIRVLCQNTGSSLRDHWTFSDAGPFDVRVLDIDDSAHGNWAEQDHGGVVVLLGHPNRLPADHRLTLSKPLRGNEFLQLLHAIEAMDADAAVPVRTAPRPQAAPEEIASGGLHGVESNREAVIRLEQWPDLPRLPGDDLHDAARICALLSVRPSSRSTISHFLDLPEDRVERALSLIRAAGRGDAILRETWGGPAPLQEPAADGKPSSFLSKIWNRLKGAA